MLNFKNLIKSAYENLPIEKKPRPWSFTNHGINLLQTEDELNCYLAAYGEMHEEKLKTALDSIHNPKEIFNKNHQVIDWGCGQGIATLCLLEFLKQNDLPNKLRKITLIEPSKQALNKAELYIKNNGKYSNDLKLVNKFLNDVDSSDIIINEPVTFNFFSNILDIVTVDLKRLADIVNSNLIGEQYFICVGPLNANSTRIDEFAKLLNFSEEQILGEEKGRLKNTRGTIKLIVFKTKGKELEIIKTIYYPSMPANKNYIHILQKRLNNINPNQLNSVERIIEYYKVIVELEQIKEPMIDNYYPYSYELDTNNHFIIDLTSNKNFLDVFIRNLNEKWPKDLIASFQIGIEDKKYALLSYTYLFEDIKDINTDSEKIKIKLSDFELNLGTLSNLEKGEYEITELEKKIKEQETIEDVLEILKEELDSNITFDNQLYFALSSKNPALSQTYSELKKINTNNVTEDGLLYKFLLNASFENKINNLTEDDLIQTSKLDESQKAAVLIAFNSKLSVITGPPGSGKTQVISNILANAVMQNKKVLVASKNNQAVDNVKTRFGREDDLGFFLRFGNKRILEETTMPDIARLTAIKTELEDNSTSLQARKTELTVQKELQRDCLQTLERRDELKRKLPEVRGKVEHFENEIKNLRKKNTSFEEFRTNYIIQDLDNYFTALNIKKNNVELKYSGLSKIWFDWFKKKKYAIEFINSINSYPLLFRNYFKSNNIPSQTADLKNGALIINAYQKTVDTISSIIEYIEKCSKKEDELQFSKQELSQNEQEIKEITNRENEILRTIESCEVQIVRLSKLVLNEKIKNKLFNSTTAHINNYKDYIPDNIPWRYEEISAYTNATRNFLNIFNISCVTSLSAKASLPLTDNLFDMMVIDEASQCDIASAIPLILRAKQLIVIGDPLQLKHISTLDKFEDEKIKEHLHLSSSVYLQYKQKSLWDYSKDFLAKASENNIPVTINRHYRCHPDIIGYSNEAFYIPKLNINLIICTTDEQFPITPKGIIWENVVGEQTANNINLNTAEVNKSIEIATNLAKRNPAISIGIITPFKDQARELNKRIPAHLSNRIIADTVHKFQGDEKDVIIYSLVVTDNSPSSKIRWIDYSVYESVNVAVTRARNTLYIVGNKEYVRRNSKVSLPLGKLVNYVEGLKV